jgi:predicted permease
LQDVEFNLQSLVFAFLLALPATMLFGALPAFQTALLAPGAALKSAGRSTGAQSARLRRILVAGEFALALVLLVAASLLGRSFVAVASTPLGFHAESVLTMRLSLPEPKYDSKRRAALIDTLVERSSALPGVVASAAVSTLPLTGESEGWGVKAADNPDPNAYTTARVRAITPLYFRTLGIPLKAGRELSAADRGRPPVVIVSETAARSLWPGVANPIGRKLTNRGMTVVGVVGDTRASGRDREVRPYLYLPFWQFTPPDFALAVRTDDDPARLVPALKAEIWRIDKDQPVTDVATMKHLVAGSIAPRRFQTLLITVFAGFALLLAALGIYGIVSYSVAQRTREIGIRMALGASRSNVVVRMMRESIGPAAAGAAAGFAASYALTPVFQTLLYGVTAGDIAAFASSAALLIAVTLFASLVPASRAAGVDPATCLREE